MKQDKSPTYTRRMVIGERVHIDLICRRCLALIPRPEEGCSHCVARSAKARVELAAFKARVAAEGGAL